MAVLFILIYVSQMSRIPRILVGQKWVMVPLSVLGILVLVVAMWIHPQRGSEHHLYIVNSLDASLACCLVFLCFDSLF